MVRAKHTGEVLKETSTGFILKSRTFLKKLLDLILKYTYGGTNSVEVII